jgi:hypothetical protein
MSAAHQEDVKALNFMVRKLLSIRRDLRTVEDDALWRCDYDMLIHVPVDISPAPCAQWASATTGSFGELAADRDAEFCPGCCVGAVIGEEMAERVGMLSRTGSLLQALDTIRRTSGFDTLGVIERAGIGRMVHDEITDLQPRYARAISAKLRALAAAAAQWGAVDPQTLAEAQYELGVARGGSGDTPSWIVQHAGFFRPGVTYLSWLAARTNRGAGDIEVALLPAAQAAIRFTSGINTRWDVVPAEPGDDAAVIDTAMVLFASSSGLSWPEAVQAARRL